MKTSSFKLHRNLQLGISIAIKHPNWFKGLCYPDLYPKKDFLFKYFKDRNKEIYIDKYNKIILSTLDPWKVYTDLKDNVLLCWESPGEFCHRRLVANWLNEKIGVTVPELSLEKLNNQLFLL